MSDNVILFHGNGEALAEDQAQLAAKYPEPDSDHDPNEIMAQTLAENAYQDEQAEHLAENPPAAYAESDDI